MKIESPVRKTHASSTGSAALIQDVGLRGLCPPRSTAWPISHRERPQIMAAFAMQRWYLVAATLRKWHARIAARGTGRVVAKIATRRCLLEAISSSMDGRGAELFNARTTVLPKMQSCTAANLNCKPSPPNRATFDRPSHHGAARATKQSGIVRLCFLSNQPAAATEWYSEFLKCATKLPSRLEAHIEATAKRRWT